MYNGKQSRQNVSLLHYVSGTENSKAYSDTKTALSHASCSKIGKAILSLFAWSSVTNAEVFMNRDGTQGAVASENEICSRIGIELIRQGVRSAL